MSLLASFRLHLHQRRAGAADSLRLAESVREQFRAHACKDLGNCVMLEVGCGERALMSRVLAHYCQLVVGIDSGDISHGRALPYLRSYARRAGFLRAAKRAARIAFFDRPVERRSLRIAAAGFRGRKARTCAIARMDACRLGFRADTFDFIYSSAVFEHIPDVDRACRELHRVLKPGGLAYIVVHLYHSLSGGHHPEWQMPDVRPSLIVPAWDHLRARKFPVADYCNRLRESEYVSIFQRHFTIRAVERQVEGAAALTPELESELAQFARKELTTRGLYLWLEKRREPLS
jgi:SAM-dependent methyltransferase